MFPVVSPPKMESIANVLYLPEAGLSTSKPESPVVKMKHDISTLLFTRNTSPAVSLQGSLTW